MTTDTKEMMREIGANARAAAQTLATAKADTKNAALRAMAAKIRDAADDLMAANAIDLATARGLNRRTSFIDRLTLTPQRIDDIAKALEATADLRDPVGDVIADWTQPNGLRISRVRVPIGVIGVIFESRPNVTADAGALCMKSGNAAILRCGSDSLQTSLVIERCLSAGLRKAGLPEKAIQLVPVADRDAVGMMLAGLDGNIDLIVPRGGKSLVERVQNEARVPVFAHLEGICHVYVDRDADTGMALDIIKNAKLRRTGICGAAETVLVDHAGSNAHLQPIISMLLENECEIRGGKEARAIDDRVVPATEEDWSTEYLDKIISLKVVDGIDEAMDHIRHYGSEHTDSIVTDNPATAERFLNELDSAIVMHNASTQFADGGEFGFGAEIGIATGKLHARGPVGLEQLTTFKYQVRGTGHTRP